METYRNNYMDNTKCSYRGIMKLLGNLVEITSTKIGQYPGDTAGDSIIATLKGSAENPETAQVHGQVGIIANPAKTTKQVRIRIGSLDILISSLNYKIPLPTNPGDSKFYSTDADGNEQATIKALADGIIEINGNSDFAVAFNDLKIGFDAFVSTFNTHVHATAATGPPSVPTVPSTDSVDASKVSEVKLP